MIGALVLAACLISGPEEEPVPPVWSPLLQQTGVYFSSERVTIGGLGFGGGVQCAWDKHFIAQADASILWGNGNAFATRAAMGYQREGSWRPAILGTFELLWGQRTEVLNKAGLRPPAPVWVVGIRGAPLRFEGAVGHASALEIGYGFGPDGGRSIELTILAAGVRW